MTADERIRGRIAELRRMHDNYLAYQGDRVAERDHHGAWDAAINLAETEAEIAGLEFALGALAKDAPLAPGREDVAPPTPGPRPLPCLCSTTLSGELLFCARPRGHAERCTFAQTLEERQRA
jgi:hypothetical protein